MENQEQCIIEKYKHLYSLLEENIEDFNQKKNKWIDDEQIQKPLKYYIVNKDIIDNCKELYLSISNNNASENTNIGNININPILLKPEILKINGFEYPYNFFLINEKILNLLGELLCKKIEIDSLVKSTLIGKEGVFLWNDPMESNKQKGNIVIYFLNDCSSEINKIYLFKEKQDFLNEFNKNMRNKEIKEYILFRNIKYKEEGLFNLIDDGKIISKYLNIIRSHFKDNEKKPEDLSQKFNSAVENDKERKKKITDFLKYLLINLYHIENLKKFCMNFKNEEENKDNSLLNAFSIFAEKYKLNENLENEINNFIKVFFEKSLGDNIVFSEECENKAYETIINKIIDLFSSESIPKKKTKNNNNDNEIKNLFYGEKSNENQQGNSSFNTLYYNIDEKKEYNQNENMNINKIISLNDIINARLKPADFLNLPTVLIIILDYKTSIHIPLELRLNENNCKFTLLSSIKKNTNGSFSSIIQFQDEHKIDFNQTTNSYQDEINKKSEINESFIFFYKYDEIFTLGNSIYGKKPSSNNLEPYFNNEGYHDRQNLFYNNI